MGISKNHSISYNIGNNYEPLTYLCLVVYATKGLIFAMLFMQPWDLQGRLLGAGI